MSYKYLHILLLLHMLNYGNSLQILFIICLLVYFKDCYVNFVSLNSEEEQ